MNLSASELQAYEALYKHQGARIEFFCDQVTYQGIIDAILPDIRQVKLRHTKIVDGDHYMGNLRFRFSHLTSFKVVESSESVNKYPRNEYLLNILRNRRPERSDIIAKALYGDRQSDESDDENEDEKAEEKFVLDLPEHLEHRLAKDYVVIDTVNETFHRAMKCIAKQETIGVSFHGSKISRLGKLTWICVSTDVCSFLFDIQQMGKEAFDNGLKDMFESKFVKKVIHDCRFPSDCLAHQYSTSLNNVFDTRAADFVISMQRYSEKYKFHSYASLDSCLRTYLRVPQEFIFQRETCLSNETKRPITNAYLYDLLKSVLYLKLLQEKLRKELLSPFSRAVGFHRTILADSDQPLIDLLGEDLSRPDRIPQTLLMNGIQTARFQKPRKVENLSLRCTFIQPQTGKVIRPYLGKTALLQNEQKKKMLAENQIVNEIHETPKQEKNPSLTNGVSKAPIKPYLGSLEALLDSLRKNEERKKASMAEKKEASECQAALKQNENPSLTNGVSKSLNDPTENSSSEVKSNYLSGRPSLRQLDEVYHRLANRKYPDQSETSVNAKPSVSSVSKFAGRQSVSPSSNTDLDSVSNKSTDRNESSHSQSNNNSECGDVWLKLREEIMAEKANSQYDYYGDKTIQYLPG